MTKINKPQGKVESNKSVDLGMEKVLKLLQVSSFEKVLYNLSKVFLEQNYFVEAEQSKLPQWLKDDGKNILQYANADDWFVISPRKKQFVIKKFSSLMYGYLLRQEKPPMSLFSASLQFKRWLVEVYQMVEVSGHSTSLSADVRMILERLLIAGEQVNQLVYLESHYSSLPGDFVAGLQEKEVNRIDVLALQAVDEAELILLKKLLAVFDGKKSSAMSKSFSKMLGQAKQDCAQKPVYKAIDIVNSEFSDKFSDARQMAAVYLQKKASDFRYEKYTGDLKTEDEFRFDCIAKLVGFSSGMHLADAILSSLPKDVQVLGMANEYLAKKFDLLYKNNEQLFVEASKAMYNDVGLMLVVNELQMFKGKVEKHSSLLSKQQVALEVEYAKEAAKKELYQIAIVDAVNFTKYMANERRMAEKAFALLKLERYEEAIEAKGKQLYYHALVVESKNIENQVELFTEYLSSERTIAKDSWQLAENFLQAADVLRRFGFGRDDYDVASEKALWEYVEEMKTVNPDVVAIAEWLKSDVEELQASKYLTFSQYEDVVNAVKNIRKIDEIGFGSDKFAFLQFGSCNSLVKQLIDENENGLSLKKLKQLGLGDNDCVNIFSGLWQEVFADSIKSACEKRSDLLLGFVKGFEEVFNSRGLSLEKRHLDLYSKFYIKEWGISLSKFELRAIVLNMGSNENLNKLLAMEQMKGLENWGSEQQIKSVLVRYLQKEDFQFVEKLWQLVDFYKDYNAMVGKMTGVSLPVVKRVPVDFVLPDGERLVASGGYYPLASDKRVTKQMESVQERLLNGYVGVLPFVNSGANRQVLDDDYVVDLSVENLLDSVCKIVHDIAFRPVMHDVNKLLQDSRVVAVLIDKLGVEGYDILLDWFGKVARGRGCLAREDFLFRKFKSFCSKDSEILFLPFSKMQSNLSSSEEEFLSFIKYGYAFGDDGQINNVEGFIGAVSVDESDGKIAVVLDKQRLGILSQCVQKWSKDRKIKSQVMDKKSSLQVVQIFVEFFNVQINRFVAENNIFLNKEKVVFLFMQMLKQYVFLGVFFALIKNQLALSLGKKSVGQRLENCLGDEIFLSESSRIIILKMLLGFMQPPNEVSGFSLPVKFLHEYFAGVNGEMLKNIDSWFASEYGVIGRKNI